MQCSVSWSRQTTALGKVNSRKVNRDHSEVSLKEHGLEFSFRRSAWHPTQGGASALEVVICSGLTFFFCSCESFWRGLGRFWCQKYNPIQPKRPILATLTCNLAHDFHLRTENSRQPCRARLEPGPEPAGNLQVNTEQAARIRNSGTQNHKICGTSETLPAASSGSRRPAPTSRPRAGTPPRTRLLSHTSMDQQRSQRCRGLSW